MVYLPGLLCIFSVAFKLIYYTKIKDIQLAGYIIAGLSMMCYSQG